MSPESWSQTAGTATRSGDPVGDGAGVGEDGAGIPGSRLIPSYPAMEFSIARSAGDSILRASSIALHSTADISITSLTLETFAPGAQVRITQPAIRIRMAYITE